MRSSLKCRDSQSVVPRPATSTSPENWLEMPVLDPPRTQVCRIEPPPLNPSNLSVKKPSRDQSHSSVRGATPVWLSQPWLHIRITWGTLKNADSWVLPLWLRYDWLGFGLGFGSFKSFQVRVSKSRAEHLCYNGSQVKWAPMGLVSSLASEWGSRAVCEWCSKSP